MEPQTQTQVNGAFVPNEVPELTLTETVALLRNRLRDAESEISALHNQNNFFRIAMLRARRSPECDGPYFALLRNHWDEIDIETILDWILVLQKHGEVFAEIARAKRGKLDLDAHRAKRDNERLEEAKRIREKPTAQKVARAERKEETVESKLIAKIMKASRCDEQTARAMVQLMKRS